MRVRDRLTICHRYFKALHQPFWLSMLEQIVMITLRIVLFGNASTLIFVSWIILTTILVTLSFVAYTRRDGGTLVL